MKPNVVVIGAGHLGKIHSRIFNSLKTCNLIGVVDIEIQKAKMLAEELGVQWAGDWKVFNDYIDAVSIVTPTPTHYEIAKEAILSGKSVFIEKPVTKSVEEVDELIKLTEKNKVIVQVGHIERFQPIFDELMEEVLDPVYIESHRLSLFPARGTEIPVVLDLMVHDIDIILQIVKGEICSIDACGTSVITSEIDIANARLVFNSGCVVSLTASRVSKAPLRKMRIFQSGSYISIDFLEKELEIIKLKNDFSTLSNVKKPEDMFFIEKKVWPESQPLKNEIEHFINCIVKKKKPKVDLIAGRRALIVCEQVLNAIANHKKWYKSIKGS